MTFKLIFSVYHPLIFWLYLVYWFSKTMQTLVLKIKITVVSKGFIRNDVSSRLFKSFFPPYFNNLSHVVDPLLSPTPIKG